MIARARDACAPSQCSVLGQWLLRGQMIRAGRLLIIPLAAALSSPLAFAFLVVTLSGILLGG